MEMNSENDGFKRASHRRHGTYGTVLTITKVLTTSRVTKAHLRTSKKRENEPAGTK
jgi:hypothetical protein